MTWRNTRVLLIGGIAVALLMLLADLRGAAPGEALRGVGGAVAGPAQQALAWARTEAGERVAGSADAERIAELEAELAAARAQAAAAAAGTLSEAQARELAAVVPDTGYRAVAARLVARATPQDQVRSVSVDAGSGQGVAVGSAVVAQGGMAGLIDTVAPGVATVRLVADPAPRVAARVVSSGEVGVFRGTGESGSFTLLDPLGAMATDDLIVTIGTPDGVLPADLPLGRVRAIDGSAADLTRVGEVAPIVDPSTLDRMTVLVPEQVG